MKTLVTCTAMSAMILCACGGKNTQSTEKTAKVETTAVATPTINQLTDQEKAEGWVLLFDGKTTKGWRGAHKDAFPDHGWMVKDGELIVQKSDGSGLRTEAISLRRVNIPPLSSVWILRSPKGPTAVLNIS